MQVVQEEVRKPEPGSELGRPSVLGVDVGERRIRMYVGYAERRGLLGCVWGKVEKE